VIRLGNASAPVWYGGRIENLDAYIDQLASFEATSTELVLHHGTSDERNARVHIQEHAWEATSERFLAHGFHCDLHASLAPAFSLRRWHRETRRVQALYRSLLKFSERLASRMGSPAILVIHAANAQEIPAEQNALATSQFLDWALEESRAYGSGSRLAIELRHDPDHQSTRFDADRELLRRFVQQFASDEVGICWDIGNDLMQASVLGMAAIPPGKLFLDHVIHVHVHGQSRNGDLHFPMVSTREPAAQWLTILPQAGYAGSVTLEIRHRLAASRGHPMEILGKSYQVARAHLQDGARTPSEPAAGTPISGSELFVERREDR
jgi:sugar phosphate isomerase/epimerase